jgi:hypothetical protein
MTSGLGRKTEGIEERRLRDPIHTFAAKADYGAGTQPTSVEAADMNGDGLLDLVTGNDRTPSHNTVSVLLNSGNGTFAPRSNTSRARAPPSRSWRRIWTAMASPTSQSRTMIATP